VLSGRTEYIGVEMKYRECICPLSSSVHCNFVSLYVTVNIVKGGGRANPPSPAWATFSIVMEFTPEIAVATLCVLCVQKSPTVSPNKPEIRPSKKTSPMLLYNSL
jgi:hypothetical protein